MPFDERYLKFFELFNERDFYECHEVLEDLWMETRAEARPYYQGLIQTATAFYHLMNGNRGGCRKLFESGLGYLAPFPETYLGFRLEDYRRTCQEWLEKVREAGAEGAMTFATEDFPVLVPPLEIG